MSWHGGGRICQAVVPIIHSEVPDQESRRKIYRALLQQIEEQDGDGMSAMGLDPIWDEVVKELNPWMSDE